jgi:Zn-dependent metalloprotease
MVDALTGKVLQSSNLVPTAAPDRPTVSEALGKGNSFYHGEVRLPTIQQRNLKYKMKDAKTGLCTCDLMNADASDPCVVFETDSNEWGNGKLTDRKTIAADTHWALDMVIEYYRQVHGRNGVDGSGRYPVGRVHYSQDWDNAIWDHGGFTMYFGDGSNKGGGSCVGFFPLVTLVICGHEMTHGVTFSTGVLEYYGEPGGLNEAMSDIFGVAIQDWVYRNANGNGTVRAPDFLIGPELQPEKCDFFLRDMKDPRADGQSLNCWAPNFSDLDPHFTSGPGNRAFYLMVQGLYCGKDQGKPAALGFDKAAKIWYRALTKYFTPTTNYFGARVATLAAAGDLYGRSGPEVNAVNAAWDIVNAPRKDGVDPKTCDMDFAAKSCAAAASAAGVAAVKESFSPITAMSKVEVVVSVDEKSLLNDVQAAAERLGTCEAGYEATVQCAPAGAGKPSVASSS